MTIPKYIILSIINTITTILPISNTAHLNLLKNIFETNIFNHQNNFYSTINVGISLSIIYILSKYISFNKITISKKHIKRLNTLFFIALTSTIPILINSLLYKFLHYFNTQLFIKKVTPIIMMINAIILLFVSNNNNKEKNIKLSQLILINLINSLSITPGLSNISLTLLTTKLLKCSKRQSLIITLLLTCFYQIYYFIISITNLNYPLYVYIICITTSIITSKIIINYFIRLYKNNKLSKIAIYLIILSTFILYWFR